MRTMLMTAAAGVALMAAASADAALFDFTVAATGFTGSGTFLTTNTLVNGFYTIVGISGSISIGATAIPIDFLNGVNTYQGNDNLLAPTGTYFDINGVSFTLSNPAATQVNFYFSNGNYRYIRSTQTGDTSPAVLTSFTLTPRVTAVPEPASWTMMAGGIGLAGMALRRRRTRMAVTYA